MSFIDISEKNKVSYNKLVYHPLQSYEWGEFRKKTGIQVIRRASIKGELLSNPYQLTVHKTPNFPYKIGYLPKGLLPDKELLADLTEVGKNKKISFIQLEPNEIRTGKKIAEDNLRSSFHPLFTKYTFLLDLTKTEDEILKNMHQKTRYNIRLSERKDVKIKIDNSEKAFSNYLKLTKQTTKRQKFYAHNENYHKLMWETLGNISNDEYNPNKLQAHLLKATYNKKNLVTYILFTFKDNIYYPYGASSDEYREVMASHAAMWGAIKFGKSLGLRTFDMWGAANVPDPAKDDPYYGFHRFKQGFGAELTEFVGSYDFIINPINYRLLTVADKIRWAYLRARRN
jgi:lipid II:glycine glycyltransferase (peptidoglycan interpeptide bridge formation enzyme)